MEYELYHDESKQGGYWHGILLVPTARKAALLELLSQARQNTKYTEPISLKNVKSQSRVYHCADCWIQIGVASLMSRTKGAPHQIYLGQRDKQQKHYSQFKEIIGAKFILFAERDDLTQMSGHQDYGSKVETTFRIGLKGGLHLLGDANNPVHIIKMHFDGYQHYKRHLDYERIVGRITGLRNYCSIASGNDVIDDRTGNHKTSSCQDYDDCQLLQLTDLLVGCFRTILGTATRDIHSQIAQPIKSIVERYQTGYVRMKNSRWLNGFCISQCYLESGQWQFEPIELIKKVEGQQLSMMQDNLSDRFQI